MALWIQRLREIAAQLNISPEWEDAVVRAILTFPVVGIYLWMQWVAPNPLEYVVPPALLSAAGIVTGFYLTGNASKLMKSLLSVVYVMVFAAFFLKHGWVPDSVNTQVMTVLGIWFAKTVAQALTTVPDVRTLTVEQTNTLKDDLAVIAKPTPAEE